MKARLRQTGIGFVLFSLAQAQFLPVEPVIPLPGEVVDNPLIALAVQEDQVDTTTLEVWVDSLRLPWSLEGGLLIAMPETLSVGRHVLRVRGLRQQGGRDSLRLVFYYIPFHPPALRTRLPVTGTLRGEVWGFQDPYPYRPDWVGRLFLDLRAPSEIFRLRVYHTTEETPETPYLSRYSLAFQWGPFRLILGDALQREGPLDLYGVYVRGAALSIGERRVLQIFGGRTQKPLPGRARAQEAVGGIFRWGEFRLGLARFRELLSPSDTLAPRDNLVLSLRAEVSHGALRLLGAGAGAVLTRDRRLKDPSPPGLSSWGLVTLNGSTSLDYAGLLEGEYLGARLRLYGRFQYIGTGFQTLGNPFLRNDLQSLQVGGEFFGALPTLYLSLSGEMERDNVKGISRVTNWWRRFRGLVQLSPGPAFSFRCSLLYAQSPSVRTLGAGGMIRVWFAKGELDLSGFHTDYERARSTLVLLTFRPSLWGSPYLTVGQTRRSPGEDRMQVTFGVMPQIRSGLDCVGALTWKSGGYFREEARIRWRIRPGLFLGIFLRNTHGAGERESHFQVESRYTF